MSERDFEFVVPPDLEAGAYANAIGVWHTPYDFTLDFGVESHPAVDADVALLVARVRLPASLLFEVIRTLNDELTTYERTFGELQPPRPEDAAE